MREYEQLGDPGRADEGRSWREVIASYRKILYSDGQERLRDKEGTQAVEVARRGVSKEEAEKVLQASIDENAHKALVEELAAGL